MCSCQSPHRCGYSLYLVITDSSIHLGIYDPNKTFHHILSSDFLTFNYSKKPGSCPKPVGFGLCGEMCSGDSSCPNNQKCCSNGCGHQCMAPYKGIYYRCISIN
uniref:WAP domain-containing protein n=1 Tax=Cyprinus carpio TaxID=7962 RepID=A0A8C2E7W7_CYPCA